MKNLIVIIAAGILTGLLHVKAYSQQSITPYRVVISYNKTSNIIFPYAIKSVDRGNPAVLVQKAKGVDNILQVKAGREGFAQTNLTVITTDGQFYSFVVDYAPEPSVLNLSFKNNTNGQGEMKGKPVNEKVFDKDAAEIKVQPRFIGTRTSSQRMHLSLQGIWLKDSMQWLLLRLGNYALIDYTPDYVRFFVRDQKRGKRTAVQETEITPLYADAAHMVGGGQHQEYVFAFQPFTIPSTQELVVQIGERNGGRALVLHIGHRSLLKARLL